MKSIIPSLLLSGVLMVAPASLVASVGSTQTTTPAIDFQQNDSGQTQLATWRNWRGRNWGARNYRYRGYNRWDRSRNYNQRYRQLNRDFNQTYRQLNRYGNRLQRRWW